MTNRQWLLWHFIELPTEELAHKIDVEWFCAYFCPESSPYMCNEKCRANMIKWLQKEHEDDDQ